MSDLSDELTLDPLTIGYAGMTDVQVRDSIAAATRPMDRAPGVLMEYLLLNRYRSNTGDDTTQSALWGRLADVAALAHGDVPLGRTGETVNRVQIQAAATVMELARADQLIQVDFADTELSNALGVLAGGAGGVQAMGPADKTAIEALGVNQQSRWQELGWRRAPSVVEIAEARA